jgi:hypothetical protein
MLPHFHQHSLHSTKSKTHSPANTNIHHRNVHPNFPLVPRPLPRTQERITSHIIPRPRRFNPEIYRLRANPDTLDSRIKTHQPPKPRSKSPVAVKTKQAYNDLIGKHFKSVQEEERRILEDHQIRVHVKYLEEWRAQLSELLTGGRNFRAAPGVA